MKFILVAAALLVVASQAANPRFRALTTTLEMPKSKVGGKEVNTISKRDYCEQCMECTAEGQLKVKPDVKGKDVFTTKFAVYPDYRSEKVFKAGTIGTADAGFKCEAHGGNGACSKNIQAGDTNNKKIPANHGCICKDKKVTWVATGAKFPQASSDAKTEGIMLGNTGCLKQWKWFFNTKQGSKFKAANVEWKDGKLKAKEKFCKDLGKDNCLKCDTGTKNKDCVGPGTMKVGGVEVSACELKGAECVPGLLVDAKLNE